MEREKTPLEKLGEAVFVRALLDFNLPEKKWFKDWGSQESLRGNAECFLLHDMDSFSLWARCAGYDPVILRGKLLKAKENGNLYKIQEMLKFFRGQCDEIGEGND